MLYLLHLSWKIKLDKTQLKHNVLKVDLVNMVKVNEIFILPIYLALDSLFVCQNVRGSFNK